jgi:hypothetical protein
MRVDFAASLAKDPDAEELNEDRYLFSLDGLVATLSDGASESFDSRSWATLLCELSCEKGGIAPETVSQAAITYAANYDPGQLSWSKAAAYERGSFATMLVLRHNLKRSEVEITGIGDTVLVLCEAQNPVRRFPLSDPAEFEARPELLSTRDELNAFLRDPLFNTKHVAVESVTAQTVGLLLTDAIGHWCFKAIVEGREEWRKLLTVDSVEAFRELIASARADKSMKIDDTTLVRVSFGAGL